MQVLEHGIVMPLAKLAQSNAMAPAAQSDHAKISEGRKSSGYPWTVAAIQSASVMSAAVMALGPFRRKVVARGVLSIALCVCRCMAHWMMLTTGQK